MTTVTKKPISKNLQRGLEIVAILTLQSFLVKARLIYQVYNQPQLMVFNALELRALKTHYQFLYDRFIKKTK